MPIGHDYVFILTLLNTIAENPVHSRDQGKLRCHEKGTAHRQASWIGRAQ